MELTFLGTGSMLPTKERNGTAVLLSHRDETLLFDCGEGTQKQMRIMHIPVTKITKILLSHWHGDHVFGLPGLLLTMGASHYNKTLEIYGPKGSKKRFVDLQRPWIPQEKISLALKEVSKGIFFDGTSFRLEALPLEHTTHVIGFSFVEKDKRNIDIAYTKQFGLVKNPLLRDLQAGKDIIWQGKKIKASRATTITKGKKITFLTDTRMCANAVRLASNADLLICEATYDATMKEKAEEYGHLTAKDAAMIAKKAKVKKLIITHFSQRYKDNKALEQEAKQVFPNTIAAHDFMQYKV